MLHVAEQTNRLQDGLALQSIGYRSRYRNLQGDEDDDVLPSTVDLGKVRVGSTEGDPSRALALQQQRRQRRQLGQQLQLQLRWTRDNSEVDSTPGSAYFNTLGAAVAVSVKAPGVAGGTAGQSPPKVLLVMLPYVPSTTEADVAAVRAVADLIIT